MGTRAHMISVTVSWEDRATSAILEAEIIENLKPRGSENFAKSPGAKEMAMRRVSVFVLDCTITAMTASLFAATLAWRIATDTLDGWRKGIDHG